MSAPPSSAQAFLTHAGTTALALGMGYVALKYFLLPLMNEVLNAPDPKEQESKLAARAALLLHEQHTGRSIPPTNAYEERLIVDLVFPTQIDTTFEDIGGLDDLKRSLYETVILPLQSPQLFASLQKAGGGRASPLLSAPRGVLFYGPAGTGKTMMARAIAKRCKAAFLNIRVSTLQSKWFGESQKLTKAIFTLAAKLAPTIVFIDEIDLFLRKRQSADHEASASMKGEFMQLWDGLLQHSAQSVLVLGATNRPWDIDDAVLRRMPRQFFFDLPGRDERREILRVITREVRLDEDVDLGLVAADTEGYSGSDLKELCRFAVMTPIREVIDVHRRTELHGGGLEISLQDDDEKVGDGLGAEAIEGVRDVRMGDFLLALSQVEPTGRESVRYLLDFQKREQSKHHRAAQAHAMHDLSPPVD